MTPAAIAKAESLDRFAKHCGAQRTEFAIYLTDGEGYELLDYLAAGGMGRCLHQDVLEADILKARLNGDPWIVLKGWTLLGFDLAPIGALH